MKNQQIIQYALMCLKALEAHEGQTLSPQQVSREQGVPLYDCLTLLERLQSQGWVTVNEGGDYALARPLSELSAQEVVQAVVQPVKRLPRFRWLAGSRHRSSLRKMWEAVRQAQHRGVFPSENGTLWRGALAVLLALALSFTATPVNAGYNVATKFADVIMEHVQQGKVYNLRTMRNLPYRVNNRSSGEIELRVQAEIPTANELKPGYEAIPDPSWVRLVPPRLKLAAGEQGLVDVILQVPEGAQYTGHHYQAHIVATTPEPPPGEVTGLAFGVALASRLRFSVASPGPAEIRRLQKKGIYQMLNFTLEPDVQFVPGFIEPGQHVKLADHGIRASLINRSPQKLDFIITSAGVPGGMSAASGYAAGDPSWLKVVNPKLKVPGESIKSATLELDLPNDPKIRGKRYMFVIQAGLEGREIPVEVYSRIYVNVAP